MNYNKKEKREVRLAYLKMILRLRKILNDAQIALIMSVADLYFEPDKKLDEALMRKLSEQFPEEGEAIMELMPAWKRWGYEEGVEKGKEEVIRKFLEKGFSPEEVARTVEIPVDEVNRLLRPDSPK